jgi:hypothetical protein
MRGKFLFFLGLGIGYVFGTRAGRRRYEQIKAAAKNIWASEPVQWSVSQAQEAVGDVADEVLTAAKRVIHQVSGDKPAPKKAAKRPLTSSNTAKASTASTTGGAAVPAKSAARVAASQAARPVTKPIPTAEPAARKSTPQPAPEA